MDKDFAKYNGRIVELRAANLLNKISKDKEYNTSALSLLLSYVTAFDDLGPYNIPNLDCLKELYQESKGDYLLGATQKDLMAALKLWYKPVNIARKLGVTYQNIRQMYSTLLDRDYITEDYISTLEPRFANNREYYLVALKISELIDNFKFPIGEFKDYQFDERTLELQFYLIYSKLVDMMGGNLNVGRFFENICRAFNIDYNSISYLFNNVEVISRQVPKSTANKHQFLQEYCNLFFLQGIGLGTISSKVFNKPSKYLYSSSYNKYTKDITNDNYEMMISYQPTISWTTLDKNEVIKFINVFYDFVKRDY